MYHYGIVDFIDDIKRIPFFRLVIPLILGIVSQHLLFPLTVSALWAIVPLSLSLIAVYRLKLNRNYSQLWIYGAHYFALLFFVGVYLIQLQPVKSSLPLGEKRYFEAVVQENPSETAKSLRLDVRITGFSPDSAQWETCSEQAIIYLAKDSLPQLSPGDVLLCEATFNEPLPPQNPGEFDYRHYLARKKIFATTYINPQNLVVVDSGRINVYKKLVLGIQNYAYTTLKKAGLGDDELSVALALLVGNKEYLDDSLRQAYASSGCVHLLAVSGLHVGIMFMVLSFLLQFMERTKRLKYIRGVIILATLWLYASVAGLAPSIVRASLMFSIFVIADMFSRPKNTYNNIALAAFVSCVANPFAVFETGFQLSYLAVLGIVFFQPKFMRLLPTDNKFFAALFGCITVTMSAQLGTLPVILYVFKAFPVYFIFSNFILVPYTSIVMYVAVAVLALSWNGWLLAVSGAALNFCIGAMNFVARFFDRLPHSVLTVNIDGWQCALLVVGILALACLFASRKPLFVNVTLLSLTGIFAINAKAVHNRLSYSETGIFAIRNVCYVYFTGEGCAFSVRDTVARQQNFDFNTRNYLISKGYNSERDLLCLSLADSVPSSCAGVVQFAGKRFALTSQLEKTETYSGAPFTVDCLYVTDNALPDETLSCYAPKQIVISGNLPATRTDEWNAAAESRHIPCHSIRTDGFWRLRIDAR
jgi:competence protein ComEC